MASISVCFECRLPLTTASQSTGCEPPYGAIKRRRMTMTCRLHSNQLKTPLFPTHHSYPPWQSGGRSAADSHHAARPSSLYHCGTYANPFLTTTRCMTVYQAEAKPQGHLSRAPSQSCYNAAVASVAKNNRITLTLCAL